jgi:hypothetical protein
VARWYARLVWLLFGFGALVAVLAGASLAQPQQAATVSTRPASVSGSAPGLKLMLVDTQRLMREAKAAAVVRQQIEQARDEYVKEVSHQEELLYQQQDPIRRDEGFAELDRDLATKRQEFQRAVADANQSIRDSVLKILIEIAAERDAVLAAKDALILSKEPLSFPDVTNEVLEKLDSRLPVVTVTLPPSASSQRSEPGEDITDLLARHKVEARVVGSGIQQVSLRIRRTESNVAAVMIPVGTYFVATNSGSQNMVATETRSVQLDGDDWVPATIPVACANKPLKVPGEEDSFSIKRTPQQPDLTTAVRALQDAHAFYPVAQAGVWIVTDNASYDGMGTLIRQPSGKRVIGPGDAAEAMKILDKAGIGLKRRVIWQRDRNRLAAVLVDQPVAEWLRAK